MSKTIRKLAIVTTIVEEWGGSEELWARAVPFLRTFGFDVTVYKNKINKSHPEFCKLIDQGVALQELDVPAISFWQRLKIKISNRLKTEIITIPYDIGSHLAYLFHSKKPEMVIISQGINFDGLDLGNHCLRMNIPYVLIVQKAVDFFWPDQIDRKAMRRVYQHAAKCYFISNQNRILTEEQFGTRFTNAEIIFNPIKIKRQKIAVPTTEKGYRLACIGRYFLIDKGQDILIRIMAMPKWKERPVTVSFAGSGIDKEGLMELAALLNLKNVEFLDQANDIELLWRNHHALLLPSRSEGTPLVLLEAMACGRTAIVSAKGGNIELITDGITGFIGEANEASFDEAMERAWNARADWESIGDNALAYIRNNIPACPEEEFAHLLNTLLNA